MKRKTTLTMIALIALAMVASTLAAGERPTVRSSYTASEIDDLIGTVASVKIFGATGNGSVDDTAAIQAAIDSLAETGGIVMFPAGRYRVNGQLMLPNDGEASNPRQASYHFVGQGAHYDGRSGPPRGGSILDLRYADGPKIVTYGLGYLEIEGLTLADFANDGAPFIYTTNTTLHIHDCGFYGTRQGSQAHNDAIILGGTEAAAAVGSNDPNAPFQGYGTVIRDNYFARIRRLVYGRVYANGVSFVGNTSWHNCGTNLPGGAAIELDGDPYDLTPQVNAGWYVAGNLIEMPHYPYGIKVKDSQRSGYLSNNFFDPGPNTLAYYRFEETGPLNYVLAGFHDDNVPFVDDRSTGNRRNTIVNTHQNQGSFYPQKMYFQNKVFLDGGHLEFTNSGARIMSGIGPPFVAAPDGSIYLRSGGGSGTSFYVRENGVWIPK